MSFRRALANVWQTLDAQDWWFDIWEPPQVEGAESVATRDWLLQPGADWHGFGDVADDYVLLDPIKVTLVTPGLSADGKLGEQGIPAAVVGKFLWERGLVVEKTGLYSFLVLFSMGITKGKWSTLLTELLEFKRSYDANAPLTSALPSVARAGGARYQGLGLRDLCDELHACYRDNATARAMRRMYTALPELAIKPSEAYDKLVRGEVEAVPIEQLQGRIAAVMLVPYPPGIPLIMPGERFTAQTRSIIDYLAFARTFDNCFPGFDSDVHGLQHDDTPRGAAIPLTALGNDEPGGAMSEERPASRAGTMGFWTCTALVVGNMIGSGVFLLPSSLAAYGGLSLFGWLISSTGAVILALTFARLARLNPVPAGPTPIPATASAPSPVTFAPDLLESRLDRQCGHLGDPGGLPASVLPGPARPAADGRHRHRRHLALHPDQPARHRCLRPGAEHPHRPQADPLAAGGRARLVLLPPRVPAHPRCQRTAARFRRLTPRPSPPRRR